MRITFSRTDRELVARKLEEADLQVTDSRINEVLYNVDAAFKQQLDEEAEYMVNEFETI